MKILFRHSLAELGEYEAAKKHFDVIDSRALIKPGDTILCRYSMLPYPSELQKDVILMGAELVNTPDQHEFVADMRNWYFLLNDKTPDTWFTLYDAINDPYDGPYVLKGCTNSRKSLWRTHMYAENKKAMREVYMRLMDDSLIGSQNIYIRKFEKFVTYAVSEVTHIPIIKEFRFFIYKNEIVSHGFYWSSYPEVIEQHNPNIGDMPITFLYEIISRIGNYVNFWVVDVAQHEDGRWRVIELNDGCMAGLGGIDPDEFYRSLKDKWQK